MRLNLDVAGRHLRVGGALRALADEAIDPDNVLVAEVAGGVVGVPGDLGVEDDLGDAEAVAQIDEDQAAKVTTAVDPALQRHLLAGVVEPELAAGSAIDRVWSDIDGGHAVSLSEKRWNVEAGRHKTGPYVDWCSQLDYRAGPYGRCPSSPFAAPALDVPIEGGSKDGVRIVASVNDTRDLGQ